MVAFLTMYARQMGYDPIAKFMADNPAQAAAAVHKFVIVPLLAEEPQAPAPEPKTKAQRYQANIAALELLQLIETEERAATPAEVRVLQQFSGWGGVLERKDLARRVPKHLIDEEVLRGTLDEYYTPRAVARSVWALIARLQRDGHLTSRPRCLEPSAGIGRFVEAAPDGLDWTIVELSSFTSRFLRVLFDAADLRASTPFQEYMAAEPPPPGGDFDIIVANPPYGPADKALRKDKGTRPAVGTYWDDKVSYFLHACARRLKPGGFMAQLVPLGFILGAAHIPIRKLLHKLCRFWGAYALPLDTFPGARLGLCLMLFQRRPDGEAIDDGADWIGGDYLLSVPENVSGKLVLKEEGAYRTGVERAAGVDVLPETMVFRHAAVELAKAYAPTAPAPTIVRPTARRARAKDDPSIRGARVLGARVRQWRANAAGTTDQRSIAEHGRMELRRDIEGWIKDHDVRDLKRSTDPDVAALRSMITPDGIHAALSSGVDLDAVETCPVDRSDISALVGWLSSRWGEATPAQLKQWFDGDAHKAIKAAMNKPDSAICVDGGRFLHRREYVTGDLYAKLDRLDESPKLPESIRQRQRQWLLETIDPVDIHEVPIDVRSGLIPLGAINEYVKTRWTPDTSITYEESTYYVESGHGSALNRFVAFLNREAQYTRANKSGKRYVAAEKELDDRMREEELELQAFADWLRASDEWGEIVADAYNRASRGFAAREVSSTPIPLARAASRIKLRPHQNEAVRRLTDTRGGVIAHDVGLGKTFLALGLVAWWRQLGLTKRPIVVVPNAVVGNWLNEAQALLPDYRTASIGVGRNKSGKLVTDTPATRLDKWQSFANGEFDLLIVGRDSLTKLPLQPDHEEEILSQIPDFQYEGQIDARDLVFKREKAEALQEEFSRKRFNTSQAERNARWLVEKAWLDVYELTDPDEYFTQLLAWLKDKVSWETKDKAKRGLEKRIKAAEDERDSRQDTKPKTLRQLEAARERKMAWQASLEYEQGRRKDLFWEDIGCDLLIVDEAHAYKNLWLAEKRFGVSPKYLTEKRKDSCKRCWDMYLKASWTRSQHDGTGVVALSATPITNSPMELYNLFYWVRPEVWTDRGIRTKEDFVDRYCAMDVQVATDITSSVKGNLQLYVSGFRHMDEIARIFDQYLDFKRAEDVGLPVPDAQTKWVEVEFDPLQSEFYEALRAKARVAFSTRDPKAFGYITRMTQAAIDPRLVQGVMDDFNEPSFPATYGPPKFVELAKQIKANSDCANLVFCSESGIDTLKRVRDYLVQQGFPKNRIKLVWSDVSAEERQHIMDALNGVYEDRPEPTRESKRACETKFLGERQIQAPTIDIVIGNQVIHEGVNLQRRACAVHHLDIPWTPAAIQQRNGRAVRQGNEYACMADKPVLIHYYVTTKSIDLYRMGHVDGKRSWLETILRPSSSEISNPMAAAGVTREDLIKIMSDDPEEAEKRLKEERERTETRVKKRKQLDLQRRFRLYSLKLEAARKAADDARASVIRRQAASIRRFLEAIDDELFPRKDLLDRAEELSIFYNPATGLVLYAGRYLHLSAGKVQVLTVNLTERMVEFWSESSHFVRTASEEKLADVEEQRWRSDISPAEDTQALRAGEFSPVPLPTNQWASLRADLHMHVLPHLWDDQPDRVWALLARDWHGGPTAIPYLGLDGKVQVKRGEWQEVNQLQTTPFPPTDAGWASFLRFPAAASKTAMIEASRAWFKRAYPRPKEGK